MRLYRLAKNASWIKFNQTCNYSAEIQLSNTSVNKNEYNFWKWSKNYNGNEIAFVSIAQKLLGLGGTKVCQRNYKKDW